MQYKTTTSSLPRGRLRTQTGSDRNVKSPCLTKTAWRGGFDDPIVPILQPYQPNTLLSAAYLYFSFTYLPVHLPSFKVSTKHRVYWFYDDGFYSTCHPNIFLKEMVKMSIPSSNQNSFSLCVIIEHIFFFLF